MQNITKAELLQAQVALLSAIVLQYIVWRVTHGFTRAQMFILLAEIGMVAVISFSTSIHSILSRTVHRYLAVFLLALMSAANISSLIVVVESLITGVSSLSGVELLATALAIFMTNIIIFALWYWEIDSPGLTSKRWSARDKDFQFTQQDFKQEFPGWKPGFIDYFYLSLTNAVNFAASDTKPLTQSAKMLMALQAIISVFVVALVVARSVSILG